MKSLLAICCLLALNTMTTTSSADEKMAPQTAKKINTVTYEFTKGDKPELVVTATTTVPTGGYKAELRRVTYIKQTADGIQDYTLYLIKPEGFVTQVISEVMASDRMPAESAGWMKGVRVHGEGDGIVVKMIDKK